ncbi:hypothetical protein [Streptomyces sp. NRRL B-24484]|uniref:tetratricopeptide repeat protein n=1 Tax=Streptomyces sp. NRRL B-24484 TaxID=1463833 RepID=UPI0004BEFA25|nr:hypothetical protein [Streptomyces sp. NRRL B-24484]
MPVEASTESTGGVGHTMEARLGAVLASHILTGTPFAELGHDVVPTELTFQPRPRRTPVDDFLLAGRARNGDPVELAIGARRAPRVITSHADTVKLLSTFARTAVERWEEIRAGSLRLCLAVGDRTEHLVQLRTLAVAAGAARDNADFRSDPRRHDRNDRKRLSHLDAMIDKARSSGLLATGLATPEVTWRMLYRLRVRFLRVLADDEQDVAEAVGRLAPWSLEGTAAAGAELFNALNKACGDWGPQGAFIDGFRIRAKLHGSLSPTAPGTGTGPAHPGVPLASADPIQLLGVHRAITADGADNPLPAYVRRVHDDQLSALVTRVQMRRQSALVCLVADPSTGKTRALWEAVKNLPAPWRVWVPSGVENLLTVLRDRSLAQRTVVWLDDLAMFLGPSGQDARSVAEQLHTALNDPSVGPLLLVSALHRGLAARILTATLSHADDTYVSVRRVIEDRTIDVAECFDGRALAELRRLAATDPRHSRALAKEESTGRITQYLSGSLEQVIRYEHAVPETRAVLHAVADAYRLGHRTEIGLDFVRAAAVGHLDLAGWRVLAPELRENHAWFTRAITETSRPSLGVPGPFAPAVSPPGHAPTGPPLYEMADHLTEHLHRARFLEPAPPEFWDACRHVTDPESLRRLVRSAEQRGMFLLAARLRIRLGTPEALVELGQARYRARDHDGAHAAWSAAYDVDDLRLVWRRADLMLRQGDLEGARSAWRAVMVAEPDDVQALVFLARSLGDQGDHVGARDLWNIADERGIPYANARKVVACEQLGDRTGAEDAARADLAAGREGAVERLVEILVRKGEWTTAIAHATTALTVGKPRSMTTLARLLMQVGDLPGMLRAADALADQGHRHLAARLRPTPLLDHRDHVGVTSDYTARTDAEERACEAERIQDLETAVALWWLALSLNSSIARSHLLRLLYHAGDHAKVDQLLRQAPPREAAQLLADHARRLEAFSDLRGALAVWRTAEQAGFPVDAVGLTRLHHRLGDVAAAESSADLAARHGDSSAWTWLAREAEAAAATAAESGEAADHRDRARHAWARAIEAGSHSGWLDLAVLTHGTVDRGELSRWGVDERGHPTGPWSVAELIGPPDL